ncbi:hypothetical protein WA026_022651 [Henosepilachna vigintioctopunctata]|uniref:Uncharacterized protein n=1 Tax=Henosepilachna vigintioctopunctata TaxID=420089 RepID=A0AAW1UFH6_9CUCU
MAYKSECDLILKNYLAEKITPYDLASSVRKAFYYVASNSEGESGFSSTGIFPLNPEVFTEEDFLTAEILQSETAVIQNCNESLAVSCVIPSTSKEDSAVPSMSRQIVSADLMMSH